MNGIHESNPHKRTSINELLNPVAGSSAGVDGAYPPDALNGQYVSAHHASNGSSSYHTSLAGAGTSFSLRAASWDQASSADQADVAQRCEEDSPTSCRYGSLNTHSHPHPHPHAHGAVYADQYQRPRHAGEPANYGIAMAHWPHASHEHAAYGAPNLTPMYSEERTAINGDAPPKSYQHPHYEHHPDMQPQAYVAPNGYYPVFLGAPTTRAMQPQQMAHQHASQPRGAPVYVPPHLNTVAFTTVPIILAQPMPQKRALETTEEDAPKTKKARGKAKAADSNTNGAAKRGSAAKKRGDGPQAVAAAEPPVIQGKVVDEHGNPLPESGRAIHPELQFARCMSNRYRSEEFPRCVSCTRRWAGDTCRFQGIRFFLKDENRNIIGISFIENQKADGPSMNFPHKWNNPLELKHINRIKLTVARALLPVLKQEEEHVQRREVIRRNRESEVRATCDTCMTSIFSTSWMCRMCGREACAECFATVSELTIDRPGASDAEIAALQAKREKHAHVNPFFLSCTRRNEHRAEHFSPMSRFSKEELTQAVSEMEALLKEADEGQPQTNGEAAHTNGSATTPTSGIDSPVRDQSTNGTSDKTSPSPSPTKHHPPPSSAEAELKPKESPSSPSDSAKVPESSPVLPPASASVPNPPLDAAVPSSIPSHEPVVFKDSELTDEKFAEVWARGEPLVVTDLAHKFELKWDPQYFQQKYGSQTCLILECQTDQNKRVTVGEFFHMFGKYEGRRDCWKLKDWPPSTDFKSMFPELYEDFNRGVPVPNYTRRDGVLNVASHFPSNTVAPDLGPKMYNAMASFESQGSKGSTRLHLDMADAVNVMLFASKTPDEQEGSAAWDLFRAEDTPKLRKFLRRKFKGQYQHDPIHSQQFYLDTQLRKELYEEYQVKSYRIYQKPGEAVFIPAGCAHQVCNLADCIKVASDFVSPDNIQRCETLTKEFREQNQSMAWKEDVLQLRTLMWFAWLSCTRQEKELLNL